MTMQHIQRAPIVNFNMISGSHILTKARNLENTENSSKRGPKHK